PHEITRLVHLGGLLEGAELDAHERSEVRIDGGIVDEDVEATEALDTRADARLGLIGLARVCRERRDIAVHGGSGSFELVLLARRDHHLRTSCCELGGDRLADALRRAGHERDSSVEADVHVADSTTSAATARRAMP